MAKHRHERSAQKLRRKKSSRPPYDRILVVCEGAKTEPQYFDEMRVRNRLPNAHIKVINAPGTQPRQIVDHAHAVFNETREFEYVFAVFDRDEHRTYHDALTHARRLDSKLKNTDNRTVRFLAVPSVPCFELWILLHFEHIQAPLHRDDVYRLLRSHMPGYQKGSNGLFGRLLDRLEQATQRAQSLQAHHDPYNGTDPYTNVDCLVTLLLRTRD